MHPHHRIPIILYFLFSILFLDLHAGTTGKLVGRVTDASTGEALAGVNVILENTTLGGATDLEGYYVIIGIPPGTYDVLASYISYQETRVTGVQINIDKTTSIDFKLPPSTMELGETIEVIADRPIVKRDLTSTESIVGRESIEALPVENLSEIVNLQAGVIEGHFRGGRTGEVLYMINGIPVNDVYSGSSAIEVENNAIQELNVISGTFNAEYGQAMSGVVNVVTKEGSERYEASISSYGGSYITTNDDIFWNENISPIYNLQGTLGGPLPLLGKKVNFFASGRYNSDAGYIYGKKVFVPTDVNEEFLLEDVPEDRIFMARGAEYRFTEQLAAQLIEDADAVSMNESNRYSGNLKITWRMTAKDKLSLEGFLQNSGWQHYQHNFRLNPEGIYNYNQWSLTNSLSWNHVFNATTFMDVHYSYFFTDFKQSVHEGFMDPRYVSKERLMDVSGAAFFSGGQQMWHFDRSTTTHLFKADLTSQYDKYNQFKIGIEGKRHRLWMHEFEVIPETETRIAPISSFLNNKYLHYPVEASAYIQDKIEYSDLVINAGLRMDYFSSEAEIPADYNDPRDNQREDAEPDWQISPRLGLAYPISEEGVIHVSYGHFFQTPGYFYLYTNPEFDIDPVQGSVSEPPQSLRNTVGNADLKSQKTVIYELGLQQQLGQLYGLTFTVFFKDIRNLLGTEVYQLQEGQRYARYINRDYGFVRGATLALEKRYSSGFAFDVDYTFQIAKGNASDPNNAFLDAQSDRETEKQVVPLDWDRRHQINGSLRLGTPGSFLFSIIARYGTGMPYTPVSRVVQPLVENGGRKPDVFTVDVYLTKNLMWRDVNYALFLRIFNLFDRLNERNVFADTGQAGYSTEPLYIGDQRPRGLNTLEQYYIRPDFYSEPRKIQIGFEVGF